jgi:inosine/xanthosine triphosphate pyrophosphatase family protein
MKNILWIIFGTSFGTRDELTLILTVRRKSNKTHSMKWKVNSSNVNKLEEFGRHLGLVESIKLDLEEPDSDALTVIRYKASQFDEVLVDDTSLFVEGENVGANIRWLLDDLPRHVGKSATFVCLIAIHRNQQVEIFKGEVKGKIVESRGNSFGFNNYFLPEGAQKTFGEYLPDELNPRYLALSQLKAEKPYSLEPPLKVWSGPFQRKT